MFLKSNRKLREDIEFLEEDNKKLKIEKDTIEKKYQELFRHVIEQTKYESERDFEIESLKKIISKTEG